MEMGRIAENLIAGFSQTGDETALAAALGNAAKAMGFDHFALSCGYRAVGSTDALLLHDYPADWAKVYIALDLAGNDPVRRACERSVTGFAWSRLGQLVPMTSGDHRMLDLGRACGIGDGFTVPRYLPGAISGSCTFAVRPDAILPQDMLFVAEIVGAHALARALQLSKPSSTGPRPTLSDRQRECVLWWGRGKTTGEIATILGIGSETVIQHLKAARERYGVHCCQSLVIEALYDGVIGYGDLFATTALQKARSQSPIL